MSTNDGPPRRTVFALTYVTVLASATWFAVDQPGAHSAPALAPHRAAPAALEPAKPKAALPAEPPPLTRNIFEYQDEGYTAPAAPASSPSEPATLSPGATAAPLVRLIGLAVVDGRPKALLALEGEVEILAVGESAAGYTVLTVDADGPTVRLKHGDEELTLTPPEER